MYDWIKYSPLALRYSDSLCDIKGPSFLWAKQKSIFVDGNRITFSWPDGSWFMPGNQFNYFGKKYLSSEFGVETNYFNKKWKFRQAAYTNWRFDGPWFTGRLCDVEARIFLLTPAEETAGISLFHPQVFESAITKFLADERDGSLYKDSYKYIAPLNWQSKNTINSPAARFESIWKGQSDPFVNYCHAVSDKCMAYFSFRINTPETGCWLEETKEQEVDRKPLFSLIDQIIDSVKVELSPESEARLAEVKTQAPDAKLSESFPPIKWPDEQVEEPALLSRAVQ